MTTERAAALANGCICGWAYSDGRMRVSTRRMGCPVHEVCAGVVEQEPETERQLHEEQGTISREEREGREAPSSTPASDPASTGGSGKVAAAPPSSRPSRERMFATANPRSRKVMLFFDRGSVELTLDEADEVVAALSNALLIARGAHPVQIEARP